MVSLRLQGRGLPYYGCTDRAAHIRTSGGFMQAIVSLLLGCLLLTTMACGGGVDSIPTAPGPNPPPTAPPPAPSVPIIAISVGEVIHATVGIQDSVCDPTRWDATAPCKRFSIVATQDGTLHAILRPTPPLVADD